MPPRSFAFVFDDSQKGRNQLAWAHWRYEKIDNSTRIVTKSVTSALELMKNTLRPGDTIGDVYLLSHGSTSGALQCRLVDGAAFSFALPATVSKFAQKSPQVKAIAPFATKDTGIHLLACNVARSQPSHGAWIQVFGGGKGWSCGPSGWFHLGVYAPVPIIKVGFRRKGCRSEYFVIEPNPRATIQASSFAAYDDLIDRYSQSTSGRPCIDPGKKGRWKQDARDNVEKDYETTFDNVLPRLGAELPASLLTHQGQLHAGRLALWALWDEPKYGAGYMLPRSFVLGGRRRRAGGKWLPVNKGGGLLIPFVSNDLHSDRESASIVAGYVKGQAAPRGRSKTAHNQQLRIRFPSEPGWKQAFAFSGNARGGRTC